MFCQELSEKISGTFPFLPQPFGAGGWRCSCLQILATGDPVLEDSRRLFWKTTVRDFRAHLCNHCLKRFAHGKKRGGPDNTHVTALGSSYAGENGLWRAEGLLMVDRRVSAADADAQGFRPTVA